MQRGKRKTSPRVLAHTATAAWLVSFRDTHLEIGADKGIIGSPRVFPKTHYRPVVHTTSVTRDISRNFIIDGRAYKLAQSRTAPRFLGCNCVSAHALRITAQAARKKNRSALFSVDRVLREFRAIPRSPRV